CKACGGVIQVPALVEDPPLTMEDDAAVPPPAPPVTPASQRPVAKALSQSQDAAAECPSCQAPLAPNAVICIACGFDLRKGVKIVGVGDNEESETKNPVAPSKSRSNRAAPAGAEKDQKWWVSILVGVALIAAGLFEYYDLGKWEVEGGRRYMPSLLSLAYHTVGKTGVLIFGIVLGLIMIGIGVFKRLRGKTDEH
ncbi:MAG TPA: hypothetical protein VFC46_01290, partial [Humisphaera sp.]|nr:hypothetical protein [Humisphaera sp.]